MVNYKSKYLAMKLKYINAKQKAGMNTTDVVGSLLRIPLGAPQSPDICDNINMYTDNHKKFVECEKLKPQCEYKFNQCFKTGFARFELNRDQLIRFTELFEDVNFDDPDIIKLRDEVAQLKKNIDYDTNNSTLSTLKKELFKKIKQYIDLAKKEVPLSTIMELLAEYNPNTNEFNIAITVRIHKLLDEFKELDMMFDNLLDEKNYVVLLQNYNRCKTITKTLSLFCSMNKTINEYCKTINIDTRTMYQNLFQKNNIFSKMPDPDKPIPWDYVGFDLTDLDLSNLDLSGFNFTYANLSGTNFNDATLIRTNFTHANLSMTEFQNADLKNAILHHMVGYETSFVGANLTDATITDAFLDEVYFIRANLTDANLSNSASDTGVIFDGANLTDANFTKTSFVRASYEGANLTNTNFSGAFFVEY